MLKLSFETNVEEAAQQIGILLVQAIQDELSGPRHGRWYPVPGNPHYHKMASKEDRAANYWVKFAGTRNRNEIEGAAYQASAPGEAPAVRTGRLRQSFHMDISKTVYDTYRVTIASNVYYADDMEYGSARVDPRPFVEPALQKSMLQILAIQREFQYKVLRGQA